MRLRFISATSLATTLLFLVPGAAAAQGPVQDWSGPYIGASLGAIDGNANIDFDYDGYPSDSPTSVKVPVLGPALTVDGGYNFQNGQFVYGIEADGTLLSLSAESKSGTLYDVTTHLDSLLSLRGRLGLATGPLLFYATAGVAAGHASFDALVDDSDAVHSATAATASGIVVGPVIGAGAEYAINRNIGLKVEGVVGNLGTLTATGDNGKSDGGYTASGHVTPLRLSTGINVHF